ncbi:MAG: valine--tRNA ligase [Candidatus Aenigmatarchaeota archaeon]
MVDTNEPELKGKRWDKEFEDPIRAAWRDDKKFTFRPNTKKPVFSIDTPPPYVNAPVHIGQAATYTIMDMIARFKRMTGHQVLFPLGLDRNGLPVEVETEKKFKVSIHDVSRQEFINMCRKLLEKSSMKSVESFYRLGHSYNSWKLGTSIGDVYHTDSDDYRKLTQNTFIDLWEKGMIYSDTKVNNYCPKCRTTIADSEIEYENKSTKFNHIKFKVKQDGREILIATTRPELLAACKTVIYNPKDERYKDLKGKTAIVPIYDIEVPIIPHTYAKIDSGTGLAMMCSFGDYTDIRLFRELKLDPVILIDEDGKMNDKAGFLEGKTVKEARESIILELESKDLLYKQETITHRTPICERSKTEIEFIGLPELYLKQMDFRDDIRKMGKTTKFFAPRSRKFLMDWIDNLSMDWAISRRRYYATEIPLWYCGGCNEPIVPKKGKYYKPWKESPPIKKCPRCGSIEFRPETRVFDTWFDSSISPLYILQYDKDYRFFGRTAPCSLRPQGKEIVRTWLYYTLLRTYQLTKRPIFENAWIHYHVLDEKGNKMSKSLGNVIDPMEVIEKFGAEPFRIWCSIEGNITNSDLKCSFDRIEGASKFLTKLWNVARFISMFKHSTKTKTLTKTDYWILKEMHKLIEKTTKSYENYDFHTPMIEIKHFIWETLASHYIELVKSRAYNQDGKFTKTEQRAAIFTLNEVLDGLLILLSPVACFITHKIYKDIRNKIIEDEEFVKVNNHYLKEKVDFKTKDLTELNSRIWKKKKDKGLSLKIPIKHAILPTKFKTIAKDLQATHNIEKLEFGAKFGIWF